MIACVDASQANPLTKLMELAVSDPSSLAEMLRNSPLAAIVDVPKEEITAPRPHSELETDGQLPFVFAHGMGDSCFNSGMKQITQDSAKHVGVYGVCIPTGDNVVSDTINGFLMTMDKSVEVFAKKIRADPKLANGFNAVGFSQGNSLIRGYIQKYNDPPVNVALHVHGTVSGVAGFPQCNPSGAVLGPVCKALAHVVGDLAYNSVVQGILFQADYFRDPAKVGTSAYEEHSQLATWNNEGAAAANSTYKENFGKTNKFVMVKALKDTMVFPNEGEWWGHFQDGDMKKTLRMNETEWYSNDSFGLRTADEAGKIFFESTPGNHLQFTETQLFGWIDRYIVESSFSNTI